jgi:hypothetical protein
MHQICALYDPHRRTRLVFQPELQRSELHLDGILGKLRPANPHFEGFSPLSTG